MGYIRLGQATPGLTYATANSASSTAFDTALPPVPETNLGIVLSIVGIIGVAIPIIFVLLYKQRSEKKA